MIPSNDPGTDLPASAQTKSARVQRPNPKNKPRSGRNSKSTGGSTRLSAPRRGSKTAKILGLLKRPAGASLQQLQKATGWQPHSVRGFLSGTLKNRLGMRVESSKPHDGPRTYRLTAK